MVDVGIGTAGGMVLLTIANIVLAAITAYLVSRSTAKREQNKELQGSFSNVSESLYKLKGLVPGRENDDATITDVLVSLRVEHANVSGCFWVRGALEPKASAELDRIINLTREADLVQRNRSTLVDEYKWATPETTMQEVQTRALDLIAVLQERVKNRIHRRHPFSRLTWSRLSKGSENRQVGP